MRSLALSPLVLFIAQAAANALEARSLLHGITKIVARQASGVDPSLIPPQCLGECLNVINQVYNGDGCQTNECVCSAANHKQLQQCLDCVAVLNDGATSVSQAQAVIVDYESQCAGVGITLPPLSVTPEPGLISATPTSTPLPSGSTLPSPSIFFSSPNGQPGSVTSLPTTSLSIISRPPTAATGRSTVTVATTLAPSSGGAGGGGGTASSANAIVANVLGASVVSGLLMVMFA